MKQTKTQPRLKNLIPKTLTISISTAALLSSFLLGCATARQHDRTVSTVLEKESVLIQKLQEERAQANVVQPIKKNKALSDAEVHLLLALEELAKANEQMRTVFLNSNPEGGNSNEHQ